MNESIQGTSVLRRRMIEDMQMRKLSRRPPMATKIPTCGHFKFLHLTN